MNRLNTHSTCPPGEFFIKVRHRDGEVQFIHGPCREQDGCHQFGASPDIKEVAHQLGAFLNSNGLPGGDFATCLEAIDAYTCQRLGQSRDWCRPSDKNYAMTTRAIRVASGGGCCGAKL